MRDPLELDSEGLAKAATAAAREGLDDAAWWDSFIKRAKELAPTLALHDVTLVLNGMARARKHSPELVEALLPRICSHLVYLTSSHLAMLASAFAKMEIHSPQFATLLTRELKARLMEFHSPMELTMIINASSRLRVTDEELYRRFVAHIQSRMGYEAFHVRDLSVIVGALARVQCADASTMLRFADFAVQTLPEATSLELARLMHACMSVSCTIPDLFNACVTRSREQAASLDPAGLSAAAFAFGQCFEVAHVDHLRYLQKIFKGLRVATVASLPVFHPKELVSLLKTFARWQVAFEVEQLRKVAERMKATKEHFDTELTVSGLHSMAMLIQRNAARTGAVVNAATRDSIAAAAWTLLAPVWSSVQLGEVEVPMVLRAVEAAAVLHAQSPQLLPAISSCIVLRRREMDGPSSMLLLEFLSQLGVAPQEDLLLVLAEGMQQS